MTPTILLDGADITADVLLAGAQFAVQVNGSPGMFSFAIRDTGRAYAPVVGKPVELYIDGLFVYAGFAMGVKRQFFFDAEREPITRRLVIDGVDLNTLLDRRIAWDIADPSKGSLPPPSGHAAPGWPDDWAQGSRVSDIIEYVIAHYTTLPDDGVTVSVDDFGSPMPERAGAIDGAVTVRTMLTDVNRSLSGVFYITPDRVLVYHDADTRTTPYYLDDEPNQSDPKAIGPRSYSVFSDGTKLVNDAMVWGTAMGWETMTFRRVVDDDDSDGISSLTDHGRWQWAELNTSLHTGSYVQERAHSVVHGITGSHKGARWDMLTVQATIFNTLAIRLGDVVTCKLRGWEGVRHEPFDSPAGNGRGSGIMQTSLPVRRMVITFPTPTDYRVDLTLSRELDDPFNMFESRWPPFGPPHRDPPPGFKRVYSEIPGDPLYLWLWTGGCPDPPNVWWNAWPYSVSSTTEKYGGPEPEGARPNPDHSRYNHSEGAEVPTMLGYNNPNTWTFHLAVLEMSPGAHCTGTARAIIGAGHIVAGEGGGYAVEGTDGGAGEHSSYYDEEIAGPGWSVAVSVQNNVSGDSSIPFETGTATMGGWFWPGPRPSPPPWDLGGDCQGGTWIQIFEHEAAYVTSDGHAYAQADNTGLGGASIGSEMAVHDVPVPIDAMYKWRVYAKEQKPPYEPCDPISAASFGDFTTSDGAQQHVASPTGFPADDQWKITRIHFGDTDGTAIRTWPAGTPEPTGWDATYTPNVISVEGLYFAFDFLHRGAVELDWIVFVGSVGVLREHVTVRETIDHPTNPQPTRYAFIAGSLSCWLGGVMLTPGTDFTEGDQSVSFAVTVDGTAALELLYHNQAVA